MDTQDQTSNGFLGPDVPGTKIRNPWEAHRGEVYRALRWMDPRREGSENLLQYSLALNNAAQQERERDREIDIDRIGNLWVSPAPTPVCLRMLCLQQELTQGLVTWLEFWDLNCEVPARVSVCSLTAL